MHCESCGHDFFVSIDTVPDDPEYVITYDMDDAEN